MDANLLREIGIAASFGLAAIGAAIGMGYGGPAAIGAIKKCYVQNKEAKPLIVVFCGFCLSNIFYGFLVMQSLAGSALSNQSVFALGVGSGLAIGIIAVTQSMCSASASDALAETGKGVGSYILAIGIAETVAVFTLVFTMMFA
jgi:V/A-type H+-transporting ATPase subunit K